MTRIGVEQIENDVLRDKIRELEQENERLRNVRDWYHNKGQEAQDELERLNEENERLRAEVERLRSNVEIHQRYHGVSNG